MKMWPGGPSAAAAQSNNLPGINFVAFFYTELREVKIQTQKPLTMVEHDAVPFEK